MKFDRFCDVGEVPGLERVEILSVPVDLPLENRDARENEILRVSVKPGFV